MRPVSNFLIMQLSNSREAVFAELSSGEIKIVECLQIYYNTL